MALNLHRITKLSLLVLGISLLMMIIAFSDVGWVHQESNSGSGLFSASTKMEIGLFRARSSVTIFGASVSSEETIDCDVTVAPNGRSKSDHDSKCKAAQATTSLTFALEALGALIYLIGACKKSKTVKKGSMLLFGLTILFGIISTAVYHDFAEPLLGTVELMSAKADSKLGYCFFLWIFGWLTLFGLLSMVFRDIRRPDHDTDASVPSSNVQVHVHNAQAQVPVVQQVVVQPGQPAMMAQPVGGQPVMMAQPVGGQHVMMAQPVAQPVATGYPQQVVVAKG